MNRAEPIRAEPIGGSVKTALRVLAYLGAAGLLCSLAPIASAQNDGGAKLVEEARCYACHHMTDTLLAPPYVAIAARHAPRKDVMTDVLARKIVHGGGGNWGLVPMVPNQWVTIEQARVMSAWILSLAPQ
jgi:cytochrome c